MRQTLLMERVLDQTRLAVVEDGRLCELYIHRPNDENLTGNVYIGRVERVLPGMNAAFVDIGLEKKGFLAAGDVNLPPAGDDRLAARLGEARIEKLARPGQMIPVQVIRSQPGAKGPRLSCHITLPGRLLALMAGLEYVGVSRKIVDQRERDRLYATGKSLQEAGKNGVILRTASQGADEEAIRGEYARLSALWAKIESRAAHAVAPRCLYDDEDLALRAVRDMLSEGVDALWTDDAECRDRLVELAGTLAPQFVDRIRFHEGDVPLFDLHRVDSQADRALEKYVLLKSGGTLVIEETEALTVVDVNTGRNTGGKPRDGDDAGETLYDNNREAAMELMRQLRLRDIGGIVVVDFIDMKSEAQRKALLELLRECAARDRNRVTVVDITPLGLVELTRKKVRQSLSRQLTHTCGACGGAGLELSHEAVARRAARDVWRRRRGGDASPLMIEAAPQVCGVLRAMGVIKLGGVSLKAAEGMAAGEYRLSVAPSNH